MSKEKDTILVGNTEKSVIYKYRGMCRRCGDNIKVVSIDKGNANLCIKCEFGVNEARIVAPKKEF